MLSNIGTEVPISRFLTSFTKRGPSATVRRHAGAAEPRGEGAAAIGKARAAATSARRLGRGRLEHAAVLCDFRLYSSDEPWDLIQAMSHVVKARWVCELSRRNPAVVPRCSVQELLEKHDECQAMLAQRGYLPAACVLPGCTTARLAETFPEELCAHY